MYTAVEPVRLRSRGSACHMQSLMWVGSIFDFLVFFHITWALLGSCQGHAKRLMVL